MEKNIYEEYQVELDMLDKFESDFNNDLITKIVILELQKCKSMENLKVNIDKMGNAEQMIENARKTIEKSAGVNPLYKEAC